jgi:putative addiction module component (TIGR02574 family)
MNLAAKELAAQARELSPQDRIALVEDILDSLHLHQTDTSLDRLWANEARQRLAAYRDGEIAARDLGDIIAKYRS